MVLWLRDMGLPLAAALLLHLVAIYCAALGWSGQSLWRESHPRVQTSVPLSARLLALSSRPVGEVGSAVASFPTTAPHQSLLAPAPAVAPWVLPDLPALSDEPTTPLPEEVLPEESPSEPSVAPILSGYHPGVLRQSLLMEEQFRQEAANWGDASGDDWEDETSTYRAAIAIQVERSWRRPPGMADGVEAELAIRLVPSGDVISVTVVRSSGDALFDASARAAVRRADHFPLLQEMPPELFEKSFRRLRLLFRPQDVLGL